jgi:hypothetical protein
MTGDKWSDADPSHNEADSYPIARKAVQALAAYAPLPDETCERLLDLATTCSDRVLSQLSLSAVADHGSPAMRVRIKALFDDRKQGRLRLDALDALVLANEVEAELLAPFTPEHIVRLGAALAPSAVVLVCRHASLEVAAALCERMGHSNSDRSLAVLGAYILHERDAGAAEAIIGLLPQDHPVRGLFIAQDELLPASVLDGLGDIKRQRWILEWMVDRVARP